MGKQKKKEAEQETTEAPLHDTIPPAEEMVIQPKQKKGTVTEWDNGSFAMMMPDRFYKNLHDSLLNFITSIRESFPDSVIVYTRGGCYKFHLILKSVYTNAIPYTNVDHIITQIDGRFYDIRGEVDATGYCEFEGEDEQRRISEQCKFPSLVDKIEVQVEYIYELESKILSELNERYFFVTFSWETEYAKGNSNINFEFKGFPHVTNIVEKAAAKINILGGVGIFILNIYEFKSKFDYNSFTTFPTEPFIAERDHNHPAADIIR